MVNFFNYGGIMETSALVLGIISLCMSLFGSPAGFAWAGSLCGVLAIIFGAIGMKNNNSLRGRAKAGLVLGVIALTWGIIATIACLTCLGVGAGIGAAALGSY